MYALDELEPSRLDEQEARFFEDIERAIPKEILTSRSVSAERDREREVRDIEERHEVENDEGNSEDVEVVNDMYRIMKNNEILGHILRSKYGSIEKQQVS